MTTPNRPGGPSDTEMLDWLSAKPRDRFELAYNEFMRGNNGYGFPTFREALLIAMKSRGKV